MIFKLYLQGLLLSVPTFPNLKCFQSVSLQSISFENHHQIQESDPEAAESGDEHQLPADEAFRVGLEASQVSWFGSVEQTASERLPEPDMRPGELESFRPGAGLDAERRCPSSVLSSRSRRGSLVCELLLPVRRSRPGGVGGGVSAGRGGGRRLLPRYRDLLSPVLPLEVSGTGGGDGPSGLTEGLFQFAVEHPDGGLAARPAARRPAGSSPVQQQPGRPPPGFYKLTAAPVQRRRPDVQTGGVFC